MQAANDYKIIKLPRIKDSKLCPAKFLQMIISNQALLDLDPLFAIREGSQVFRVKALNTLVLTMGLNHRDFGFHTFRLEKIKEHGHWKSDSVWT